MDRKTSVDYFNIVNERGELDECKCLSLLFIPHEAYIQVNGLGTQKVFIFVKPSPSLHRDL